MRSPQEISALRERAIQLRREGKSRRQIKEILGPMSNSTLDEALKGREILIAPNEPSAGVRVAFILDDGAPVELLQFSSARDR